MGASWNRKPTLWIKHRIEESTAFDDPKSHAHALLWIQDLNEKIGDDPRRQALASLCASHYAECVRVQAELLKVAVGTSRANALQISLVRLSTSLARSLRMLGIKPPTTASGARQSRAPFSAPRMPHAPLSDNDCHAKVSERLDEDGTTLDTDSDAA